MGYHTDFGGQFKLDKPMLPEHVAYIRQFNETRRMKRKANVAETLPDPKRLAVKLPIGNEGAYFVGGTGFAGQDNDASVLDHNAPPKGQPGLWCQWTATEDGQFIEWDGGEKFYNYIEWLQYIVDNFLIPWGYKITGTVEWHGEDHGDMGRIIVKNNKITVKTAHITFR